MVAVSTIAVVSFTPPNRYRNRNMCSHRESTTPSEVRLYAPSDPGRAEGTSRGDPVVWCVPWLARAVETMGPVVLGGALPCFGALFRHRCAYGPVRGGSSREGDSIIIVGHASIRCGSITTTADICRTENAHGLCSRSPSSNSIFTASFARLRRQSAPHVSGADAIPGTPARRAPSWNPARARGLECHQ